MRLAVDEMLQGLGRWLRAAGYDTLVATGGMGDAALLDACRAEGRVLITRDRALAERGGRGLKVVVLPAGGLVDDVRALNAALEIDWRRSPFTRCVEDNTVLRPATEAEVARMPESARILPGPLRACPACGRLYWPGSHVRRMQARLDAFARGGAGGEDDDQLSETPGVRT
jgi:uncharacterized protein with PIN domain